MSTPHARLLAAAAVASVAAGALGDLGLRMDAVRRAEDALRGQPLSKLAGLVAAGALLFYRAESGRNPSVRSYWDALVHVAACASGGSGGVVARTVAGKAIGSAVMTLGPTLAGAALASQARASVTSGADDATQREILATLKAILAELEQRRPAAPASP